MSQGKDMDIPDLIGSARIHFFSFPVKMIELLEWERVSASPPSKEHVQGHIEISIKQEWRP